MIKEEKVFIPINIRNSGYFNNIGYVFDKDVKILEVSVCDLKSGSKTKVTAVCEICKSENYISYSKYILNRDRNNKGYYSCFGCKNIEKEKTCLNRYGVISFSMTDVFKESESIKWKGIQKGSEKGKKTMIEKYGVDSFFKTQEMRDMNRKWMSSDEFKEKSKETLMSKYGVESYSKTDEFKEVIKDKKYQINEKIRNTFIEKYGVDSYSKTDDWKLKYSMNKEIIREKIIKTCMQKYGVDNVFKHSEFIDKSRLTKELMGNIVPDSLMDDWNLYKRKVRKLTNRNKRKLYEEWNGLDYYDQEKIIGNLSLSPTNGLYPTLDHKISTIYGFLNDISFEDISDISNLCITKRYINSSKSGRIEVEFIESLKPTSSLA